MDLSAKGRPSWSYFWRMLPVMALFTWLAATFVRPSGGLPSGRAAALGLLSAIGAIVCMIVHRAISHRDDGWILCIFFCLPRNPASQTLPLSVALILDLPSIAAPILLVAMLDLTRRHFSGKRPTGEASPMSDHEVDSRPTGVASS